MANEVRTAREAMQALEEKHTRNPSVVTNLQSALFYLELAEERIAEEPTTQEGLPFESGALSSPSSQS